MKIENYGRLIKRRYKTTMTITTAAIIALLLNSCFSAEEASEKTGSAGENFVVNNSTSSEGGSKVLGIVSEKKLTGEEVPSEVSSSKKETAISTDETLNMGGGLLLAQNFVSEGVGKADIATADEAGSESSIVVSGNGTGTIDKKEIKPAENKYNLLIFGNHKIYREDNRSGSGMGSPIKMAMPPIKIWDLGNDIEGTTYTLKTDETSKDLDGLRTEGAQIINEATITLESTSPIRNSESYAGMRIEAGGVGVNKGTIKGNGTGMKVTDGVADNRDRIEITGDYGMYAGSGGTAINNTNGRITNDGNYGMYADKGGIAINKDWAFIQNTGDYGMYATNGGIIINEFSIQNPGDYGMVVYNGGFALNHKPFNFLGISNHGNYGMLAEGNDSVIINDLKVDNGGNYGMVAKGEGSIAINKGTVSNGGDYGIVAEGIGSTAFNEGTVKDVNDYGMIAMSGGQILNDVGGTVRNTKNYGISASGEGSTGLNRGTVSNGGDYGMSASSGSQVLNEAGGTVKNTKDYGISASGGGSIALNKGIVSNAGDYGMSADQNGSTAVNKGEVSNDRNVGMNAIEGGEIHNYGTVSNGGDFAKIFNKGYYGMRAEREGRALNRGTISNANDYGMYAISGGIIINEVNGTISNDGNFGIYAGTMGSKATNKGMISNKGDYGMNAIDGGKVINAGTISNIGDYGMRAERGGAALNRGMISNKGTNGYYGMYAADGGTIINEGTISNAKNYRMHAESGQHQENGKTIGSYAINRGILDTGSDNYTVMSGRGENSVITNDGTITINHNDSVGMKVSDGATAINNGIINLNKNNGTGILAIGSETTYINNGTINFGLGSENKDIVLKDGATMNNSGTVVNSGTFDFSDMGDGKFVLGTGGTIESDKIEGDFYAGSSLVLGGYEEKYTSYDALKTKNIEGNIFSDSAMFNSKIVKNGENYDVVLERKSFKSIIDNSDLGKVLENNYADNGNPLKENYYDALKSISDAEGLNEGIEDSYGMEYYPTIAKQTFDMIDNSNRVITNNVIKDRRAAETGEITAIVGGDFTKLKEDSYESVSGYDLELYSVYLGAEKQIKEKTRVGGILTVGKASAAYKDMDASRDDYYYQGSMYIVHESENRLKFTSMIFAGITDTDLERDLSVAKINETLSDNVDNYYVGIENTLAKRWDLGKNYIEPKAELNITHMMQGEISEKGDYGVDIDGVDSTSIETGVGVAVGRDIFLSGGSKINLEFSFTGYAELGNPYEDLNSTFKVLSDEKVKISGYEGNDYYGDAVIRGSYATPQLLTVYTEAGYRTGDTSDSWLGSVGLKFLF